MNSLCVRNNLSDTIRSGTKPDPGQGQNQNEILFSLSIEWISISLGGRALGIGTTAIYMPGAW